MMTPAQRLVHSHARSLILLFLVLGLVAAGLARSVRIDGSVDRLMLRDDPARLLDQRAKLDFGNDEIIWVGFELDAAYQAADLRKLARISDAIAELDHVRRVRDLSSTEDVVGDGDLLDARPLIDFARLDEELDAIRARAKGHPLYDDLLVSDDERSFGMMIYADTTRSNDEATNQLTAEVMTLVDELAPPWRTHYAGYPVTAYEVNRIVKRDLALLTPIALAAIGMMLFIFTRRASAIALLVVLVLWVELVALGWLGATGTPINVVISALPTILVATAGTYLVYAVGLLKQVQDRDRPAIALVGLLQKPVFLSSASTAIGFGSLGTIGMQSAGELGSALAVGILAAAAGTLLLVPALVEVFGLDFPARRAAGAQRLGLLGVRWARRPVRVVLVSALLITCALPGLSRLELQTDTLQYFAAKSRVRSGARYFQDHLSSGFLLNVVIRAEAADRAIDPDTLDFAEVLVERIETIPQVDRTISMLDYFGLMDAALRPEAEASRNPGSREKAAQYLLLYASSGDPEDYERYLDFERKALSVIVPIRGGSKVYLDVARRIAEWAEAAPPDVRVDTLGTTYLYSKAMDDLTRGMARGLMLASLLIFVVLILGLRSLPLALLSMIPNMIPIAVCGGLLGWLGVPISMSTSLMGCIALGLAVDDTSHVVGHVGESPSLQALYGVVGVPIVQTTLSLCAGFSVLLVSEFATIQVLGAAVVASLGLALVADLVLLPSLLALAGTRRTDRAAAGPQTSTPRKKKWIPSRA